MRNFIYSLFFGLLCSFFTPTLISAENTGCDNAKGYCIEFQEAIGETTAIKAEDGTQLISAYIGLIYKYGAGIIGIVCVLIIVFSGIQISMGGASNEMVTSAKDRIVQALLSLILLFSSALILKTVNPGFFYNNGGSVSTEGTAEVQSSGGGGQTESSPADTQTPAPTP